MTHRTRRCCRPGSTTCCRPRPRSRPRSTARLMGVLAAHGYERVKPPLVEFEETLLAGAGSAMASDTFRTMDPISHRMVAVRADMTPQVARIAATRLAHRPRPLRLSYAGQVLRVRGSQMRPERQFGQAGAELIGAAGPAADVEAIAVAGEALDRGRRAASVGRHHPADPGAGDCRGLRHRRRAGGGAARRARSQGRGGGGAGRRAWPAGCWSPWSPPPVAAEAARAALDRLDLPERARIERDRLGAVLDGLAAAIPDAQGHRRPGREPRLRVPHRHQLHVFRAGRSRARAAGRTRPRRPLRGRRPAGAGAGHRLHAVHRHDPAHLAGAAAAPPGAGAARRRSRPRPRPARGGVDHRRGAAARADWRDEARRLGCGHVLEAASRGTLARRCKR